jgi:GNAT superfamily N-acetyltransferase
MIREARANETETLLAIQRDACVTAFAHIFPPDRYPFPDDLIRGVWEDALADPDVEVFVAEDGREPVGSVSIGGEFLRTLYVVPSHWRTGIGSALHDHALDRLRARGCARAKLWTLEENWDARRYYEKRGWTLNGETRVVPFPPNPIDVGYSRELELGDDDGGLSRD